MKKLVTITAIMAALALAGAALAAPPGAGPRHGGPHHGPGMHMFHPGALPVLAEALELTEDQQATIESLFEEMRPQPPGPEVRERMQSLREQMHELWQAESPDRGAILAKMAEMDALRAELRAERRNQRISLRLAVLDVLTPEQRAELTELREEMRERRQRGPGRRGPGRAPCWKHAEPDTE
jgi:Spy/CpxP family protein refolding chaperone